jgi:Holliday junction resolvase RusA-like endonuclease
MTVEFTVVGVAQQMGSKRAYLVGGHPVITDANRNLKSWQYLVRQGASQAMEDVPPLVGAVRVTMAVFLPRPKSLPKKVAAHVKAPDLDKLVRGTADALSKIVFRDDSQVVDLVAMKRYAPDGVAPRVKIRVETTAGAGLLASQQPLFELVR